MQEEGNPVEQGETSKEDTEMKQDVVSENEGPNDLGTVPEEDRQTEHENEPELTKRLNKQRRRAIQAVQGGRKNFTSRNSYKDKGGRSSHNSKIQKQLGNW